MAKKYIPSWDVFVQMLEDLTTKDTHRAATLSYAYLANQLGHIALGYIIAAFAHALLEQVEKWEWAFVDPGKDSEVSWWAFGMSALIWFLVEAFYVRKALMKTNKDFQRPKLQIIEDVSMDILFFWFGGSLVLYFRLDTLPMMYVHIGVTVFLFFWVMKWYRIKMCQQYIRLPFHQRLMDTKVFCGNTIPARLNMQEEVLNIVNDRPRGHWIFYGGNSSGKTGLAVGIASDAAFKKCKTSYQTMSRLIQEMVISDAQLRDEFYLLWSWRDSDLLIIDDIVITGETAGGHSFAPECFVDELRQDSIPEIDNYRVFREKAVIWILGTSDEQKVSEWTNAIRSIDEEAPIKRIKLVSEREHVGNEPDD